MRFFLLPLLLGLIASFITLHLLLSLASLLLAFHTLALQRKLWEDQFGLGPGLARPL